MLVNHDGTLNLSAVAYCVECIALKVHPSQLNFFDRGAKFVARSIEDMFDVVAEVIDASVPAAMRPPASKARRTTAGRPAANTARTH
jgi:hypothetical protein